MSTHAKKPLPNIEKSAFRRGEYVGYGGGKVWRISKTKSSYGNWIARDQAGASAPIYAFRLSDMSAKLEGAPLICAHSGREIPSAYGEVEAGEL